jgi:transcriptional regulator of nitric oxide reductase
VLTDAQGLVVSGATVTVSIVRDVVVNASVITANNVALKITGGRDSDRTS